MTTLQEYLDEKYPSSIHKRYVLNIEIDSIREERRKQGITEPFTEGELDLSKYPLLRKILVNGCKITKLTLGDIKQHLKWLKCAENQLTSIDFLTTLSNPEKLKILEIYDNNIEPTTLDFLRPFVNLKFCKLGENVNKTEAELKHRLLETKIYNKFCGSLEPIKDLKYLEEFCVAGTDVEEGLEYIPAKIAELSAEAVKKGKDPRPMNLIDCQPLRDNAKVAKIQDQLRPFNYDIAAWQLVNNSITTNWWIEPKNCENWSSISNS